MTDYNAKVTSIQSQIAGVTKNTTDNFNDITKDWFYRRNRWIE